jgi:hypothetical protein
MSQHSEVRNWQPVATLPIFGEMIEGKLSAARDMQFLLNRARNKPHVLDDETVDRIVRLYSEQRDDHWFLEHQLNRWRDEELDQEQAARVQELIGMAGELQENNQAILDLVGSIQGMTIEKILAMDPLSHIGAGELPLPDTSALTSIESKDFHCEQCRSPCMRLIFAPNAASHRELRQFAQDYAFLYSEEEFDVWVIGPPLDEFDDDCDHHHLQVAPSIGEVETMPASEFNAKIRYSETHHCRPR